MLHIFFKIVVCENRFHVFMASLRFPAHLNGRYFHLSNVQKSFQLNRAPARYISCAHRNFRRRQYQRALRAWMYLYLSAIHTYLDLNFFCYQIPMHHEQLLPTPNIEREQLTVVIDACLSNKNVEWAAYLITDVNHHSSKTLLDSSHWRSAVVNLPTLPVNLSHQLVFMR